MALGRSPSEAPEIHAAFMLLMPAEFSRPDVTNPALVEATLRKILGLVDGEEI
jgi:hypothetical protein